MVIKQLCAINLRKNTYERDCLLSRRILIICCTLAALSLLTLSFIRITYSLVTHIVLHTLLLLTSLTAIIKIPYGILRL